MFEQVSAKRVTSVARLRAVTGETHARLERRLNAIERFSQAARRKELIERFAALHLPAALTLARHLRDIPGLDFEGRSRARFSRHAASGPVCAAFPEPRNAAEALGVMYVLEGSTLGGRLILQAVADRGIDVSELAFMDPYGADTGRRWRSFLAVLERETADDDEALAGACRGALAAFVHAEQILCGAPE